MAVTKNISINIASQAYLILAAFVSLPLILNIVGAEAYGLIGFFSVIQVLFGLMDAGLSGVLTRDIARFRAKAIKTHFLMQLMRTLEMLFMALSIFGCAFLYYSSSWIASDWISANQVSTQTILLSIKLIGFAVAIRFIAGLFRAVLVGYDQHIWLSIFNISIATLRFFGAVAILTWFDNSITTYFFYQILIVAGELLVLRHKAYRLLPSLRPKLSDQLNWLPIKKSLKLSMSLSFLTFAWILFTQLDKLLLAKLLPLIDYGYFSVATTLAGGLLMISGPVGTAILPRLTLLNSKQATKQVVSLYRHATQIISCIVIPLSVILALYSRKVLWVWTGDDNIVEAAFLVLSLYSIGNCMITLSSLPFYLQYAKGSLRINVIGNTMFVVTMLPAVIVATQKFGAIGAGWNWVFFCTVYLVGWIGFVHSRLIPGIHLHWLFKDIAPSILLSLIVVSIAHLIEPPNLNRTEAFLFLAGTYLIMLLTCGLSIQTFRKGLFQKLKEFRGS